MNSLSPTFSVTREDHRREVHYELNGLFTQDNIPALMKALYKASEPFILEKVGFRVMGDLREFSVQTKEIAPYMQASQDASASFGVDKMAIIYSSMLVKQQFKRVSTALDLGTFTDKSEALAWLRS